MDKFTFFNRRALDFPINTEIDGGAIDFPTKNSLASYLQIPSTNIKSFTVIGDNIRCHMSKNYIFKDRAFSGSYNKPGGSTITAYRDFDGKVVGAASFVFSQSVVQELILNGLTSIGNQTLRSLFECSKFIAPNLVSFGNDSLSRLGTNTSGLQEGVDFIVGFIQHVTGDPFEGSKIIFSRTYPNVTGNCGILENTVNQLASVFPNQSSANHSNCYSMLGHDYPNVTFGDGIKMFYNNRNAEYIRLPNLETIEYNDNGGRRSPRSFGNTDSLTELDIRKLKNWEDFTTDRVDNPLSDPYSFIYGNNSNLTVHAHIDLKTSGNWFSVFGTNVHSSLQKVINDGGTVNWYNEDGTFNSTDNN